jgi:hypothetical protein
VGARRLGFLPLVVTVGRGHQSELSGRGMAHPRPPAGTRNMSVASFGTLADVWEDSQRNRVTTSFG